MTCTRLLSFVLVLALFTTGTPLYAQSTVASNTSDLTVPAVGLWKDGIGEQIGHLLASPYSNVQEKGLELIIELSHRNDPTLNLAPSVKSLLAFYRSASAPVHRRMAVAALHNLNHASATLALLDDGLGETDSTVRRMILSSAFASPLVHRDVTFAEAYNRLLAHDRKEQARARASSPAPAVRDTAHTRTSSCDRSSGACSCTKDADDSTKGR